MIKLSTFLLLLLFLNIELFPAESDTLRQTIKGVVINYKTQQPIQGVNILVMDTKYGSYSKSDGTFKIPNVPTGRYIIRFSSVGFETTQYPVVLNSGKEEILNIQMQESFVQMNEVIVTANKNTFAPINESAIVSSTVFTIDDVERFAGSRMDPARMAQNYAGVVGANDVRNDIIIRGGSPTELLWRLDGLDVPNPNHFATQGATGGPVNALNSNVLDNSDFLVGAWPAEYIDKMSGVFDLRTRKGNDEKYEFMGQFGFNGFELGAEGPIPIKKSSFIANYRYSFLDLMEKMGIDFGFSGIPRYQDGILKMDFQPNDKNQISFTGMFGLSGIEIAPSKEGDIFRTNDAIKNETELYIAGINWQYLYTEKSYGKLTAGAVFNRYIADEDSITLDENDKVIDITPMFRSNSLEGYYTIKYAFHYAANSRNFLTAGIENRFRFYNLYDEEVVFYEPDPWHVEKDGRANQVLSYVNWNWRITEDITSDIGISNQYFDLNKKFTVEPRFGISWNFLPLHKIAAGFGVHKQSLPLIFMFSQLGNDSLDFMQSLHYVLGYSYQLSDDALIKVEGYYKDISKAPVEDGENNSLSFLNSGASFGIVGGTGVKAKSTGIGRTYGYELTIIKNFSDHYYVTATASYIRQQYQGSDGIWRFGAWDNIFVCNLLSGYEWIISPRFTIEFSAKYTLAGGSPYIPIDLEKSIQKGGTKYNYEEAYSVRKPSYSRFDVRIDFRNNFDGYSIISYVSAENVLNTQNIYDYTYENSDKKIEAINQLGFFFVGGVKVEF